MCVDRASQRTVTAHHGVDENVSAHTAPPVTPDGRYIVVRDRLWRAANPRLTPARREALIRRIMDARRAVGRTKRADYPIVENAAHAVVIAARVLLGERGAPWWDDGSPEPNRHMAKNTIYADWFNALDAHPPLRP